MTTAMLEWLHPMRLNRYAFGSSFNPLMSSVAAAASVIRSDRHAVTDDARLKTAEIAMFDAILDALMGARKARDAVLEELFERLYASGANGQELSVGGDEPQRASECCGETVCSMKGVVP